MKKTYTILLTLIMVITVCMPAMAGTKVNITIPKNQVWSTKKSDSRTGYNGYVSARCHSVYPESGTDNFSKIQCRVVSSSGNVMVEKSYYVLSESASAATDMNIKDGYFNLKTVYFQFRGNSSDAANAVVSYYRR